MGKIQPITPCLWFDDQAEEAAKFYTSVFENSKITETSYYSDEGKEFHHKPAGSVMTVSFELDGQPFTALNGGPIFKFNESISFQVICDTQDQIDHYWDSLSAGGDPASQQCGWLKDRFGVSWQVAPKLLHELLKDPDREKADRVMLEMLKMKKFDMTVLKRAAAGDTVEN